MDDNVSIAVDLMFDSVQPVIHSISRQFVIVSMLVTKIGHSRFSY